MTSTVVGIVTGLGMAFPLLIIGTKNVIVGFMATASIAFVTVAIVGIIPMGGWELGVSY